MRWQRRTQAQVPGLAGAAVGPRRAARHRGVGAEDPRAERELGAALLPVQGAAVRVQARRQDAPRLPPLNTTLVSGNIYVNSETLIHFLTHKESLLFTTNFHNNNN